MRWMGGGEIGGSREFWGRRLGETRLKEIRWGETILEDGAENEIGEIILAKEYWGDFGRNRGFWGYWGNLEDIGEISWVLGLGERFRDLEIWGRGLRI